MEYRKPEILAASKKMSSPCQNNQRISQPAERRKVCVLCGKKLDGAAHPEIRLKNGRKVPVCLDCAMGRFRDAIMAIGRYMKSIKEKNDDHPLQK